ncbi:MAG: polysaccharide biosynthesis C-terminal domain-containing protein [Dehalococcoidia bacterium]
MNLQPQLPDRGGGFLFNVNVVFLSQIAIYGLAFLLRIVLAQGLGDDGLGTYSLFFIAVLVAGGVANLGVGLGNIYFLNKGTYDYSTLLSGSLFVFAATAIIGWLFLLLYGVAFDADLFVSGRSYWMYAAALPAIVAYVLLTSFLHGDSRFFALSSVAIVQGIVGIGIVSGFWVFDELDVFWAVTGWAISFAVADVLCLALIGPRNINLATLVRPKWKVLGNQIRYGAQGQVANLAQLFNYRLDQFLVAAFVSRAGVGHYTVAVGVAESVWWISSSVAMVLLPRLTSMDKERAEDLTPLICRNTLLVSVFGAIGLSAISPFVVPLLFGGEFDKAVLPLILLMPGIIAASATRVLGTYFFSQGRIILNTYVTFIALGVTIALDFIFIPWLQVEGAAIASSIAYVTSLVATLYWYRKISGRSPVEALVVRPSDVHFYIDVWERIRDRNSAATDETG